MGPESFGLVFQREGRDGQCGGESFGCSGLSFAALTGFEALFLTECGRQPVG